MFSALNQGSLIYVLDKTDGLKFKVGQVIGVSQPKIDYQYNSTTSTIDIKVSIDGNTYEYNSIPSNYSSISYNNGAITLSETKQLLQTEVEGIYQNSKQHIENMPKYEQNLLDCEDILKQLNPQYAKDKERDDKISNLEERFSGVETKLDKIFNLINK